MARLAALLLLAGATLGSSTSEAAFSPPFEFSASGQQHAEAPQVAIDPEGDALVVWRQLDGTSQSCCYRVVARARTSGGALRPERTLSNPGHNAFEPQVVIDGEGDALVVWRRFEQEREACCYRIQARAISAAGVLGPVQTLSVDGVNAFSHQVAVDGDGDAVVVWKRGIDGRIQARARSASGALAPPQSLSSGYPGFDPQVALDADGDAIAVWHQADDAIRARARSAAGVLGAVETLSPPGGDASGPQVAVDADGDALAAWVRFDGNCCHQIQARARSAAGVLGSIRTLSIPGRQAFDPQVAVDPDGDALVVWAHFDGSCCYRIQARARSAAGALLPVQTLSPTGQNAFVPQVAIDADGDAVAVWERFGTTFVRVQARTRLAGGTLGPLQTISTAAQSALGPQVAVDADGDALAVWAVDLGENRRRVEGAAGP